MHMHICQYMQCIRQAEENERVSQVVTLMCSTTRRTHVGRSVERLVSLTYMTIDFTETVCIIPLGGPSMSVSGTDAMNACRSRFSMKPYLYLFLGMIGTSATAHLGSNPTVKKAMSSSLAIVLICNTM